MPLEPFRFDEGSMVQMKRPHGAAPSAARSPSCGCSRWQARLWKLAGRWALACSGVLCAVDAGAQEGNTNPDLARSVAVTGREAFNAGDYETALALFRRAYALFPAPTLILYEARSLEKLGRWIEAAEAYTRTAQTRLDAAAPEQFAEAVAAARTEARELRAIIPTLTPEVSGVSGNDPNLRLEINGRAIGAAQLGEPLSLNPGTYKVSASLSAERHAEAEAVLGKSDRIDVVLDLAAPQLEAPTPHAPLDSGGSELRIPMLAIVAGAVGVAGVGAGITTGAISKGEYTEAKRKCVDDLCTRENGGTEAANAFRTWRTVSTVAYGVGVTALAAGVVLWLTADDPAEAEQTAITPWIGPNSAGVHGRF